MTDDHTTVNEARPTVVAAPSDLRVASDEERRAARRLAETYGLEYVEMSEFRIDNDLFRSIPFDLMLRYGFVPEERL